MTEALANKVYDVLVNLGGAHESSRDSFVFDHTTDRNVTEWRFQGKLGFGGKFRSRRFTVDCYQEDEATVERFYGKNLIPDINEELQKLRWQTRQVKSFWALKKAFRWNRSIFNFGKKHDTSPQYEVHWLNRASEIIKTDVCTNPD